MSTLIFWWSSSFVMHNRHERGALPVSYINCSNCHMNASLWILLHAHVLSGSHRNERVNIASDGLSTAAFIYTSIFFCLFSAIPKYGFHSFKLVQQVFILVVERICKNYTHWHKFFRAFWALILLNDLIGIAMFQKWMHSSHTLIQTTLKSYRASVTTSFSVPVVIFEKRGCKVYGRLSQPQQSSGLLPFFEISYALGMIFGFVHNGNLRMLPHRVKNK